MKQHIIQYIIFSIFLLSYPKSYACSILYYVDAETGKIYVVNNEDYFLDVDAYIQIQPRTKKKHARLWYGWDNFAQGGINERGLFFDAAVTPEQEKIKGYSTPKSNLGDDILAHCATVNDALAYIEKEKIALHNSHFLFGDKTGNAVVVEWVNGERKLHWIEDNYLIATNYLLSKPEEGNYPCHRYESIEKRIHEMEGNGQEVNLLTVGNTFGQAGQLPAEIEEGRFGGTVYTSFVDITDGKFYLSYQLSNENVIKLSLSEEFTKNKKKRIPIGQN